MKRSCNPGLLNRRMNQELVVNPEHDCLDGRIYQRDRDRGAYEVSYDGIVSILGIEITCRSFVNRFKHFVGLKLYCELILFLYRSSSL